MANVLDVIIRAQDMASGVMEQVGKTGAMAASWLETNWAKVGIASAGAGLALEGLARQQAPLTEQTRKLAVSLGMTEKEVRDLTAGLADVGLPMGEAIGLMQAGREQGLRSAEQLAEYTRFWDDVADATGGSAIALADAGAALRAVGIAAGEESKAVAALGFIHRETSADVNEFLGFIGRTGPQLRAMGMDVNDAAAVLGVLEKEFGMTGRVAKAEFNRAVQEAEGDMGKLMEILGITGAQFEQYKAQVAASSDVIAENAAIQGESFTLMQKLQHAAAEMTYRYGDLIGTIGNLSPALMAVGPIIKGLSAAKTAWAFVTGGALKTALVGATAKTWAFTTALLANPIGLVIAAVAGLALGVVALIRNWGTVGPFFSRLWDRITAMFSGAIESIRRILAGVTDAIAAPFRRAQEIVGGITDRIGGFLQRLNPFSRSSPSLVDNVTAGVRAIQQEYGKLERMQLPALAGASAHVGASSSPVQGPLIVIEQMNVRSQADIDAVSRQLYGHIQAAMRAKGGR